MSEYGPIFSIFDRDGRSLAADLTSEFDSAIAVGWSEVSRKLNEGLPAAIIVDAANAGVTAVETLARRLAAAEPYIPLIALDPAGELPGKAIPFTTAAGNLDRLIARLRAALRVRALHATMLRRQSDHSSTAMLPDTDPLQDATVLLLGRGTSYPTLSVALGEKVGVVGALSIEAAAKHLNARDVDGIVIGDGFTARVLDAFLAVLSEDPRFRNLPIIAPTANCNYDLPNLEATSDPTQTMICALPLIRQHAFEQRVTRILRSIDAGGLLDPRSGLLTAAAFDRDLATAIEQAQAHRSGLSIVRFSFSEIHPREQYDAARILSRLMRRMDFATLHDDGSMTAVFVEVGARNAAAIAKRLASVMKHTVYSARRGTRLDPHIEIETLRKGDTAATLLARLGKDARRAAS